MMKRERGKMFCTARSAGGQRSLSGLESAGEKVRVMRRESESGGRKVLEEGCAGEGKCECVTAPLPG